VSTGLRGLLAGLPVAVVLVLLASCASQPEIEPAPEAEPGDGLPATTIKPADVKDAVPRQEPWRVMKPFALQVGKYYLLESTAVTGNAARHRGMAASSMAAAPRAASPMT
jgi:hypothetical protein